MNYNKTKFGLLILFSVSAGFGARSQESATSEPSGKVVIERTTPEVKEILDRTRPVENREIGRAHV